MRRREGNKRGSAVRIMAVLLAASLTTVQPYGVFAADAEETVEVTDETQEESAAEEESGEAGTDTEAAAAEEPADKESPKEKEAPKEEAKDKEVPEKKEKSAASSIADELTNQRMQIADDDILQIRIGYVFDDGSFDEWTRGTAFVVGPRYLLTRQSLINTRTESALYKKALKEKEELYKRVGVSLNDEVTAEKHIRFFVEDREGHTLAVSDTSIKNGLGLVVLKNSLENVPAVVFADPTKTGLAEGMQVNLKAAGNMDGRCDVMTISGTVVPNEDKDAGFSFTADDAGANIIGAPLYDTNGHVIGMVSGDGDTMTAFTISALETFLSMNGIQFRSIEKIQLELAEIEREAKEAEKKEEDQEKPDFSELEAAIADAESIESLSGYTDETAGAFSGALESAKAVLANEEATQEEADSAAKTLKTAQNALEEKKGILDDLPIIPIAIAVAVLAGVVSAVLALLKKKKSDTDDDEEETYEEPKREKKKSAKKKTNNDTLSGSDSYDDDSHGSGFINDDGIDITYREAKGGRVTEDESPGFTYMDPDDDPDGKVQVLDEDGSSNTTLLSKKAYLIRKDNGKRIPITKDKFVIGKERRKVDYCIGGNPTISRQHCRIRLVNDNLYLEDLDSMNYTFIDGDQIPAYQPIQLEDGNVIRMSNVDFEFHKS